MPPMYPVHRGIDSSFLTDSRCGHNMEMMSRTGEDIDVPCGQMILARGSEVSECCFCNVYKFL